MNEITRNQEDSRQKYLPIFIMIEQEANCSRNECLSSDAPETRAAALLRGIFSVPEVLAQLRGACTQSNGLGNAGRQARGPTDPLALTALTEHLNAASRQ